MKRPPGMGFVIVLILACQGPQGPKGEQGEKGPQGEPAPPPVIAAGGGLSGNGTVANPLAVAAGGISAEHLAGPTRIYSRLMTPTWLQANADIHSARVATINPMDISFGTAGTGNLYTRLFTVPLLPANTLQAGETYLIRIVAGQTVASPDNDPMIGITDGTSFIGIMKQDALNSDHTAAVIADYGNNLANLNYINLGGPGQNAETFEILLRLGPTGTSGTPVFYTSNVGTLAGRYQADLPFNRTVTVSLAVFGKEDTEMYTFHGFEVTIDREG